MNALWHFLDTLWLCAPKKQRHRGGMGGKTGGSTGAGCKPTLLQADFKNVEKFQDNVLGEWERQKELIRSRIN